LARPPSVAKLGYYPCPESQVDMISSWLSNPNKSRLVDPCVGEAEALVQLKDNLGGHCETWAIELSPERFQIAAPRVDICLPTSFYLAKWWDRSVSLAWVNPPYDYSEYKDLAGKKIRHERLFIQKCTPKLVPGGILVAVIPQAQLTDEALATILAGWYDRLRMFKFAGDDYNVFKQVFVIGVRKEKYRNPRDSAIEGIQACGKVSEARLMDICKRPAEVAPYVIPALTDEYEDVFSYTPMTNVARLHAVSQISPVRKNLEYHKLHYLRPLGAPIAPAIQEKTGHIAMELSSGDVGVVPIDIDGQPALIKGTLVKETVQTVERNDDPDAETQKVTATERLVTRISVTKSDGEIRLISSAAEVSEMMMQYGQAIAKSLLARNVPTYDMKPYPWEWDLLGKLGQGLKPLPGRKERGMFEMQKHLAIATERVSKRFNHVLLNAEMGVGKTGISTCALELLNKWPVILICPGHMQEKWKRELAEVSVQTDKINARIVDVTVREGRSWYESLLVPMIHGDPEKKLDRLGRIVECTRLQLTPTEESNGRRAQLVLDISPDRLSILMARLKGARLRPEIVSGNDLLRQRKYTTVEINDRDAYTLPDFVADYQAGKLGHKAVLICSFEVAKMDAGFEEVSIEKLVRVVDDEGEVHLVKRRCCPTCGQPLKINSKTGRCGNEIFYHAELEPEVTEVVDEDSGDMKKIVKRRWKRMTKFCDAPYAQMSRWRKQSLARLVQKKYTHFFKVYVADEVHKNQGGSTDIGNADSRFISAVEHSIALTGTLFGGKASSLFYLLYRRVREVRDNYEFGDGHSKWVDDFGLWEHKWTEELRGEQRGVSTGLRRFNKRSKEKPGISPAVIRYILPQVIFGKITDLGYHLPPLNESINPISMAPDQQSQYDLACETLLREAMIALKEDHDAGPLAAWLNVAMRRPNSAFRDEQALVRGEPVYDLPDVSNGRPLPKEKDLAETVRTNKERGRKTLVFVEQTASRDIRQRLKAQIENLAPGVRVGVLSSNITPRKRELWIAQNIPNVDVLIANPKLVETGLDLVMFQDIIFFEITYSLYVLWQAMRRVWRLGQSQRVHVSFYAYRGTLEAAALALMGTKMKFAMMLYGDNAAGTLVDETDETDDDLQREMMRRAVEGVTYEDLGQLNGHLFTDENQHEVMDVTDSPLGSPTAQSTPLPTIDQPAAVQRTMMDMLIMLGGAKPARKRTSKSPDPALQASLF
jgi:hypothetical protein